MRRCHCLLICEQSAPPNLEVTLSLVFNYRLIQIFFLCLLLFCCTQCTQTSMCWCVTVLRSTRTGVGTLSQLVVCWLKRQRPVKTLIACCHLFKFEDLLESGPSFSVWCCFWKKHFQTAAECLQILRAKASIGVMHQSVTIPGLSVINNH